MSHDASEIERELLPYLMRHTVNQLNLPEPIDGLLRRGADEIDRLRELTAATTEMLALCRDMENWLRPEVQKEPDRTYFWKLVEVIRKAEGKEPLFKSDALKTPDRSQP